MEEQETDFKVLMTDRNSGFAVCLELLVFGVIGFWYANRVLKATVLLDCIRHPSVDIDWSIVLSSNTERIGAFASPYHPK